MAVPLAAGVFSAGLAAQAASSLVLYGIADVSVRHASNTDASRASSTRLANGASTSSRLGLRGSEALTADLQSVFGLEMDVNPLTGAAGDGRRQFNRVSYAGLRSRRLGELTAGRRHNMVHEFLAFHSIDALGVAREWSYYVGTQYTPRYDNAVRYHHGIGGLLVSVMGVFDQSQAKDTHPLGAALLYKGLGWQFGGAYMRERPDAGHSGATRTSWVAGGTYELRGLSLRAFYLNHENEVEGRKDRTLGAGAICDLGARARLLGQLYHTRASQGGAKGRRTAGIAVLEYDLSRRSQPYLGLDYTRFAGIAVPGSGKDSRLGITAGLRHRF